MPGMPRDEQVEDLFEDIMGEPHNVTRNIPMKNRKPRSNKPNPNGDVYNQRPSGQRPMNGLTYEGLVNERNS